MTNPKVWEFDRYLNGQRMAEGVRIERAGTFEEACRSAVALASPGSVLVVRQSDELTQLRCNLSLAEEGLANYALEIERAQRIMRRAISWLQIKEAAFASAKGPAIIEEMQRFCVGDSSEPFEVRPGGLTFGTTGFQPASDPVRSPVWCSCPPSVHSCTRLGCPRPSAETKAELKRLASREASSEPCGRLIFAQHCQKPKGHEDGCEWSAGTVKEAFKDIPPFI